VCQLVYPVMNSIVILNMKLSSILQMTLIYLLCKVIKCKYVLLLNCDSLYSRECVQRVYKELCEGVHTCVHRHIVSVYVMWMSTLYRDVISILYNYCHVCSHNICSLLYFHACTLLFSLILYLNRFSFMFFSTVTFVRLRMS